MAPAVELDTAVVERVDDPHYCGLLFFTVDGAPKYLPWSVTFKRKRKKAPTIRLYPHDDLYEVVDTHNALFAHAAFDAAETVRQEQA